MSQSTHQTNEYISLIARHQTAIYAFVRSMVTNAADAQDIAQETNIALWSSMGRFKLGTDFYAYATHIAYRQVCDHAEETNAIGLWSLIASSPRRSQQPSARSAPAMRESVLPRLRTASAISARMTELSWSSATGNGGA